MPRRYAWRRQLYAAAVAEYPTREIELRQGARVIEHRVGS